MNALLQTRLIQRVCLLSCPAFLALLTWGLLSSDPFAAVKRSPFSAITTISDLVMHGTAYFVLSVLCFTGIRLFSDRIPRTVWAAIVLHALVTECLQAWIPLRSCDPMDATANLCGIAVAAAVVARLFSRVPTESAASA